MDKLLEKELSNFAESSRARETMQFGTITQEDLQGITFLHSKPEKKRTQK